MTLVELIYNELLKKDLPHKAVQILESEINLEIYDDKSDEKKNLHSYLAKSNALAGNWEKAYWHLQNYTVEQKELRGKSIQARIDSLNVLYETVQKEKQIAQQELILQRRKKQNQALIGGALALLIISGLIIYINRRRLAFEKQQRQQESKIQKEKLLRLEQENKIMAMDYVLLGEENERKRIAKDLHDSLGSLLSSAQLQLDRIQSEIDHLKNMDLFSNAESLIKNAAQEVRRISHDMMPEALINLGLQASIEDLASGINMSGKIECFNFLLIFR